MDWTDDTPVILNIKHQNKPIREQKLQDCPIKSKYRPIQYNFTYKAPSTGPKCCTVNKLRTIELNKTEKTHIIHTIKIKKAFLNSIESTNKN